MIKSKKAKSFLFVILSLIICTYLVSSLDLVYTNNSDGFKFKSCIISTGFCSTNPQIVDSTGTLRTVFINFNITNDIQNISDIKNATLQLQLTGTVGGSGAINFTFQKILSSWNQSDDSIPLIDSLIWYGYNQSNAISYKNFTITEIMKNITYSNSEYGFSINDTNLDGKGGILGLNPILYVTYDGINVNTPILNQEVLNTFSMNINVSQTGYNQTTWVTINGGKYNKTICTDTSQCFAQYNFTYQGFINMTVYANKTTGEITSKTINNIFVGNQTQISALDNDGKDKYCSGATCTNSTSLVIGNSGTTKSYGFIYFNLTNLENNSNIKLVKANFSIFLVSQTNYLSNTQVGLFYLNSDWNETDNSIPLNLSKMSNNTLGYQASDLNKRWYFDTSDFYYNITSGSLINYGLKIHDFVTTSSALKTYRSSENVTEQPYLNVTYYTPNSPPNQPTLISPEDLSAIASNNSIIFNWTDTDPESDNMTYSLFMDINSDPTTLINITRNEISGNYYSFNYTNLTGGWEDGVYYWKVYASDGVNENVSSDIYSFQIASKGAIITIISPLENKFFNSGLNIYFNWSALAIKGLSTCELWGNWTGVWHKNYTWTNPTNNTMNWTSLNISNDGRYIWNIRCNDTLNNYQTSINRTFGVDTKYPILDISSITTIDGNQVFSFNFNINETNLNTSSCKYTIYNSSGGLDSSQNITIPSCSSPITNAQVSAVGASYLLKVYASDLAGNENSTNKSFTVNTGGGVIIVTGGGGGTTYQSILASNFSILSTSRGNTMDIVLAKNSVKPRQKEYIIISKEKEPFTANLHCDTTNLDQNQTNQGNPNIDICDYVVIENPTILVSPNEDSPTVGKILVYTPENASIGDTYYFNLILERNSVDNSTSVYSKLSVSNRVTWYALFIYKWRYLPFTSGEDRPAYPVFLVSLGLFFTILFSSILLFNLRKKKLPVTGFIIGIALGTLAFIVFSIYS